MRCWCRMSLAFSRVTLPLTVTRFSLVMSTRDRPVEVVLEAQVAVGEDADEPAPRVLDDRDAGDAVLAHQLQRLADRPLRA